MHLRIIGLLQDESVGGVLELIPACAVPLSSETVPKEVPGDLWKGVCLRRRGLQGGGTWRQGLGLHLAMAKDRGKENQGGEERSHHRQRIGVEAIIAFFLAISMRKIIRGLRSACSVARLFEAP